MKSALVLAGAIAAAVASPIAAPADAELEKRSSVYGFDISHYQGTVDFKSAYSSGARFVIIKATEGTDYEDPAFSSHYDGATSAGFIRGGYHFARPDQGAAVAQAQYFYKHGGGWSGDGITLPGMLDIEYGYDSTCWGLSTSSMVAWINDWVNEYHSLSGRWPLIYTTNNWWQTCTGNTGDFNQKSPLVLADYNSSPGTIPGGWPFQTFWQYNDAYKYGGDSDVFNGAYSQLQKIATG